MFAALPPPFHNRIMCTDNGYMASNRCEKSTLVVVHLLNPWGWNLMRHNKLYNFLSLLCLSPLLCTSLFRDSNGTEMQLNTILLLAALLYLSTMVVCIKTWKGFCRQKKRILLLYKKRLRQAFYNSQRAIPSSPRLFVLPSEGLWLPVHCHYVWLLIVEIPGKQN